MSKSSYVDLEDGKWFTFDRPQKIACCSCNHVHLVELRLHEGLMQMRMITDKRATGQLRRRAMNKMF